MRRLLPLAGAVALMLACDPRRSKPVDDENTDDAVDSDTEDGTYQPETDLQDTSYVPIGLALKLINFPFLAEEGDPAEFVVGSVTSADDPLDALTWSVSSSLDGPQPAPEWTQNDRFRWPTGSLSAGSHVVTFEVSDPDGNKTDEILGLDICRWPALQDFNSNPIGAGWRAFGNATWDAGGWMEITGNAQSRAGSIYKVDDRIDPGDVRVEFDIATGGGINSGADGYSVNIVDVPDVETLTAYINASSNGGCLGYGSAGLCGTYPVRSFHIEFDTWYNNADPVTDPTSANHIAITQNGDPTNHLLWVATQLEDNALTWKHVIVETIGERVRVNLNGTDVIDQTIPGFRFDGGWIGVSGSTGWASNYHRFDNLLVRDRCDVPQ